MKRKTIMSILCLFLLYSCTNEEQPILDENVIETQENIIENNESNTQELDLELLYKTIPRKEYTIDIEYWDIPNNRTNAEKTTDNLQAAIDWAVEEGYGIIRLPAGHYMIGKFGNSAFQEGITLKSNMAFIMDEDAIIEMVPNNLRNYYVVAVTKQEYVYISGGTIIGDRYDHVYTEGSTHEGGHCIAITHESKYVTVENMTLKNATGDGIVVVAYGEEGTSVQHVNIINNEIFNNRRQGISIVGGTDINIENNEIHHISGTAPQFGIDIEGEIYTNSDITIRSNYIHHCSGGNIVNFDGTNVLIENNTLDQGDENVWTDANIVVWCSDNLIIHDNLITANDYGGKAWLAILMYPSQYRSKDWNTWLIYENRFENNGMYIKDGANLDVYNNEFIDGGVVFEDVTNLNLFENIVERDYAVCINYSFINVTGSAEKNINNGSDIEINLNKNEPLTADACQLMDN